VRYTKTVAGTVPLQIDYSDYRDVNGVKMAFHWVVTWTDRAIDLSSKRSSANVQIESSKLSETGSRGSHKAACIRPTRLEVSIWPVA